MTHIIIFSERKRTTNFRSNRKQKETVLKRMNINAYTSLSCDYTRLTSSTHIVHTRRKLCCKKIFTSYRVFRDRLYIVNILHILKIIDR